MINNTSTNEAHYSRSEQVTDSATPDTKEKKGLYSITTQRDATIALSVALHWPRYDESANPRTLCGC
jgi:hypothetical protein